MGTPTAERQNKSSVFPVLSKNALLNQLIWELASCNYIQSSETRIKNFDLGILCESASPVFHSCSGFKQ